MSDTDLCFASATELGDLIRARSVSPVEVMRAVLSCIEAREPRLNAMITLCADRAMDEARRAEAAVAAGDDLPPLHGVPLTVKDLLNTEGVPTTFGSHAFAGNSPALDCVPVARLRRSGAILMGKSTTPEFGHKPLTEAPLFGRTLNPWNLDCTPGGSSGGAAAAAAAGYGPLHVGTDGGGSVRIPSACCGIFGHKATLGVVPHDQSPEAFANLSYIGPMTRTVADSALMMDAMAGPHRADPYSLGWEKPDFAAAARPRGTLDGVRIGWRARLGNDAVDAETERLFEAAVQVFTDLGARVESRDDPLTASLPAWGPITFSAWASRFGALADELGDRMSASLSHWIDEGRTYSSVDVMRAMALRTRIYREVQAWFERDDLILMPTLSRPPLPADHQALDQVIINGEPAGQIRSAWYPYTHPFNMSGNPAASLPCGWTEAGLPVGLQIVGPWHGDAAILRAAAEFEQARPWRDRRPPEGVPS